MFSVILETTIKSWLSMIHITMMLYEAPKSVALVLYILELVWANIKGPALLVFVRIPLMKGHYADSIFMSWHRHEYV